MAVIPAAPPPALSRRTARSEISRGEDAPRVLTAAGPTDVHDRGQGIGHGNGGVEHQRVATTLDRMSAAERGEMSRSMSG